MKAQNKTMKAISTSNSRPLHRALYTLLLGIAALWAMPRNAHAQLLYVAEAPGGSLGTIGTYDAGTGAAINATLITSATGLSGPVGLALSGNTLFVANINNNTIGKYDATTGAAINVPFITGVNSPLGLALSGNDLFVGSVGMVGKFDASTGVAINANFITGLQPLYGFISLALSGNTLFVEDYDSTTIGKFDATTGAAISVPFVTVPVLDQGLAVSGDNLFVANGGQNTVREYSITTGALINVITAGLSYPIALAVSGNNLYVSNATNGTVGKYDATTGAAINATFITGLPAPYGLAVASVPEPSPWSMVAVGGVALLGITLRKRRFLG
jgi:sugar lactone lactonase YvrE